MKKFIIPIVLVAAMLGQAPPSSRRQPAPAKSGVDTIIELVQGGASESTVIKALRSQATVYKLSPDDLLKLQKAGVSETIINVMTDPKTPVAAVAPLPVHQTAPAEIAAAKGPSPAGTDPAPAQSVEATATPYPPDLQVTPVVRKRRIIIEPFNFGAIKDWVQSTYHTNDDIGMGIRAMLMTRLQQSGAIVVLERSKIEEEQNRSLSAAVAPGTGPVKGAIWGADCVVMGDITTFGRDDKDKSKGGGGLVIPGWKGWGAGGAKLNDKEQKAVVGIDFRMADAETSAVILAASAKGESARKSKNLDFGGFGVGGGGAAGGIAQSGTSNSNFAKTIIGEATVDAVNKIAQQIEAQISQIPLKPRKIEGRVAKISANGVFLAVGNDEGVAVGDRFEIRRIDNEVLDPQTKERIALEAVKVGELVVTEVNDKHAAIGNYGGQALSPDYVTAPGKGYEARLMSK